MGMMPQAEPRPSVPRVVPSRPLRGFPGAMG